MCVDKIYKFSRIKIAKILDFITMTVGINQNFVIFFNYTKTFIQNTHSDITYRDIIIWLGGSVHYRTSDGNNDNIRTNVIIIMLLHVHNTLI